MKKEAEPQPVVIHKSVLIKEMLYYLNPKSGGIYLDATFGSGGHTQAVLQKEPKCTVIALDWDIKSLDTYGPPLQKKFGNRLHLVWGNFALLYKIVKKEKIGPFDGILSDFGTSQVQIMERPGFSIYRDTKLDMRMSPAHQRLTAAEVVNKLSQQKLQEIFWQLGEERYAKQIAHAIVQERSVRPIKTTGQLADLVVRVVPIHKRVRIHPATKIFQALRIYINKELENIQSFLAATLAVLKPEGRLVCITFHSLEDRLVKQFFQTQEIEGQLSVLTKEVVLPSDEEIHHNPSARSAKLRAAQLSRAKSYDNRKEEREFDKKSL